MHLQTEKCSNLCFLTNCRENKSPDIRHCHIYLKTVTENEIMPWSKMWNMEEINLIIHFLHHLDLLIITPPISQFLVI